MRVCARFGSRHSPPEKGGRGQLGISPLREVEHERTVEGARRRREKEAKREVSKAGESD